MNIFRVVNTVLYPLFIFLLLFNGRNLVDSTDLSAGSSPGSGAGTPSTPPDKTGPASTPPPSTNESQPASATPPASPASGTDDKSKGSETTTPKTGVELCIKNNKKATDQFDHKQDGKVVTYTAKGDYGFKLVKQKTTEIWKSDKEKGYATKVVLDGKGKKEKVVTIYFPNNITKSYKKDGKNKTWNEVSQDNKEGTGFELNIKKGEEIQDNEKYSVQTNGDCRSYYFKPKVKCNLVKVDDQEVWKFDSSKTDGKYPDFITCEKYERLNIGFADKFLKFKKDADGKWIDASSADDQRKDRI